jgi:hypothetical protein
MFQLVSEDEYGTRNIVASGKDVGKLVQQAKKFVCEANLNNALTAEEQKKNFEEYFPVFIDEDGKETDQVVYAGKKGTSTRLVYVFTENTEGQEVEIDSVEGVEIRFFIGEFLKDKKKNVVDTYYAEDYKSKVIDTFKSDFIKDKTSYFIRKNK